jgi:hypothetical protein
MAQLKLNECIALLSPIETQFPVCASSANKRITLPTSQLGGIGEDLGIGLASDTGEVSSVALAVTCSLEQAQMQRGDGQCLHGLR